MLFYLICYDYGHLFNQIVDLVLETAYSKDLDILVVLCKVL